MTTNAQGKVIKDASGWRFDFFGGIIPPTTAIYTFVFNVTETCEWTQSWSETQPADVKGLLQFDSNVKVNTEAINQRIEDEEWTPEPLVILSDGEFIALGDNNAQFNELVTEQLFVKEFSKGDKVSTLDLNWFTSQSASVEVGDYSLPLWAIIVLIVVLVGLVGLGIGIYKIWTTYVEKMLNEEQQVLEECAKFEREGLPMSQELQERLEKVNKKRGKLMRNRKVVDEGDL